MSALTKMLGGAAGVVALATLASPAAAQYGYPYPNGGNTGVVGAIIGALGGGYGQYGYGNYGYNQVNDRTAVNQCTAAVEARLNGYGQQGYGQQGYGQRGYGYNNGYANYGGARIAGITRVERRSNGGLKVYGVAMTSAAYGGGYNQGYNRGYNNAVSPDLKFNCKVDRVGRVTDVDLDRMTAYNRGDYYYGYRPGY